MFSNLSGILRNVAIFAPPMLMAVTVHEVSHGFVAALLGDPTARRAGRLTLNPIKHLDPLGLLVFIITQRFGWAKPVPVDISYFKNPQRGMALVSVAGPVANFTLAVLSALALRGLDLACSAASSASMGGALCTPVLYMLAASVQVNLVLGIFNLLPIPPLDGGHFVMSFLPRRLAYEVALRERWGFVVIILLSFTPTFGKILGPPVNTLYNILIS